MAVKEDLQACTKNELLAHQEAACPMGEHEMKKLVIVTLDGAADSLSHGPTPLQRARTPNLDGLARAGATASIFPVNKGYVPETHTGVLSLLGYDVEALYTKRGPIEASGFGLAINEGELAFRANLATLGEHEFVLDRRVCRDITQPEADALVDAVNQHLQMAQSKATYYLKSISTYRCILTISSSQWLSDQISGTDPGYSDDPYAKVNRSPSRCYLRKCVPLDGTSAAALSAMLVNDFTKLTHHFLNDHPINEKRRAREQMPANALLVRDPGNRLPKLQPLTDLYGLRFAYILNMPIERGIARLLCIPIIEMRAGRDLATIYSQLANDIVETVKSVDVVLAHVKGPDEPGHDGDVAGKVAVLELVDKHLVGKMVDQLDLTRVVVCVTSDHATPCHLMVHSDEKVPLVLAGGDIVADSVAAFDEASCMKGELSITHGRDLMPYIVSRISTS